MLKVFDRMSAEFAFHVVNASRSIRSVAADLRRAVTKLIDEDPFLHEGPRDLVKAKTTTSKAALSISNEDNLGKIASG
jgi:hypothetical protein